MNCLAGRGKKAFGLGVVVSNKASQVTAGSDALMLMSLSWHSSIDHRS